MTLSRFIFHNDIQVKSLLKEVKKGEHGGRGGLKIPVDIAALKNI